MVLIAVIAFFEVNYAWHLFVYLKRKIVLPNKTSSETTKLKVRPQFNYML